MIKKILSALLVMVASATAALQAQETVGSWNIHTPFSGVEDMVETQTYLYYMSSGSLFRIDKDTYEVIPLSVANNLNDSNITGIFPGPNGQSVFVTYGSGNMDRLYDSGKTVNLPDIKDANINDSKRVNDVVYFGDRFYVATDFGFIVYNEKKNEVVSSFMTSEPVKNAVATGSMVGFVKGGTMYMAPSSATLNSLQKFEEYTHNMRGNIKTMLGLNDTQMLVMTNYVGEDEKSGKTINTNYAYFAVPDADAKQLVVTEVTQPGSSTRAYGFKTLYPTRSGAAINNGEYLYTFNRRGEVSTVRIPSTFSSLVNSAFDSPTHLWVGQDDGVSLYNISDHTSPTAVVTNITGSDMNVPHVYGMCKDKWGNIYYYTIIENDIRGFTRTPITKVNMIRNGRIIDVTGKVASHSNGRDAYKNPDGTYKMRENYQLIPDNQVEGQYYIGTAYDGLYYIDGFNQSMIYQADETNAGFTKVWIYVFVGPTIVDRFGNLITHPHGSNYQFYRVAAADRLNPPSTATWKGFNVDQFVNNESRDAFALELKHSNLLLFAESKYSNAIMVYDNKGTATLSDDQYYTINQFIDQDNKKLNFSHVLSLGEDKDGRIWVGGDRAMFYFTLDQLASRTGTSVNVTRPKIARNDGTNLADYLCENTPVTGIDFDAAGNAWLSTAGAGVYQTNADGTKIHNHFTSENSILPSNTIFCMSVDPNSNKIYFGLENALVEYSSDSAPGQPNYDNVVAYPNPVRPDYTGWITIKGLMDNSLVKICDSSNRVFATGMSNGGIFTWDGCNANGERVKSGVYFVYASTEGTDELPKSACVTKILVVN